MYPDFEWSMLRFQIPTVPDWISEPFILTVMYSEDLNNQVVLHSKGPHQSER